MKTKLITALRSTANALEQETFHYNWDCPSSCNCGSLFCTLTGNSAAELKKARPAEINGKHATWKILIGQHCPVTGIPKHKLFKELLGYGLTPKDMIDLEYLSNPLVRARMNVEPVRRGWLQWIYAPTPISYTNKQHVIAYMRAWADLLAEEGALDTPQAEEKESEPCVC